MSKVLLVTDIGNWAWALKAKALKKCIGHEFDKFDVIVKKQFKTEMLNKYNTILFFGWIEGKKYAKYKGVISAVSSHNYLYKHLERAKKVLPKYDCITCTSKILHEELTHRELNKNIYLCPNGVDTEIFTTGKKTQDLEHFTVLWVGQPTSGEWFEDAHGYENVVLPLKKLLDNHKDIKFNIIAKTFKNATNFNNMPDIYRNSNLYLHTGSVTGTPNTAFEAQACGIPVISTAIGAIPELINAFNGWIVPRYYNKKQANERVEEIYNIILKAKDMNLLDMKINSRKIVVSDWDWRQRARAWIKPLKLYGKKL